jgi:two-component system chemotaxis response regulator CheB
MTAAPTRVLVVDDSVVVRRMVGRAIEADPGLELVGSAANGSLALAKLSMVRPDVVVLDLEMPVMDGFETLAEIRRVHADLPVIVFSNLTVRGARATLEAIAAGATAFALKPNSVGLPLAEEGIGDQLLPLIKALAAPSAEERAVAPRPAPPRLARSVAPAGRVEVVVIAVSTGGPKALEVLLAGLPGQLAVPVLVVQHMPPVFTGLLAERLDSKSPLSIVEATEGMAVGPGRVFIAPGGRHMSTRRVGGQVQIVLEDGPLENGCRPAADVLFRSIVDDYGAAVLALVLTGMGHDGLRGSERVRAAGGAVLAQTPASSIVASMPSAIIDAGLADGVIGLDALGGEVLRRVSRGR